MRGPLARPVCCGRAVWVRCSAVGRWPRGSPRCLTYWSPLVYRLHRTQASGKRTVGRFTETQQEIHSRSLGHTLFLQPISLGLTMFFARFATSGWKFAPVGRYAALISSAAGLLVGFLTCIPALGGALWVGIMTLLLSIPVIPFEFPLPHFVTLGPVKMFYDTLYYRALSYVIACIPMFFSELCILSGVGFAIAGIVYAIAGLKGEKPPEVEKPASSSSTSGPSGGSSSRGGRKPVADDDDAV